MERGSVAFVVLLLILENSVSLNLNRNSQSICRGLEFGTRLPNPKDKSSFFNCLDGYATLISCQDNSRFDPNVGVCQLPLNPCNDEPDQIFVNDLESCAGYYYCHNGNAIKGNCPDGLHFDEKRRECIRQNESECKDRPNLKEVDLKYFCERMGKDVIVRDAVNCGQYYVCDVNGRATERNCSADQLFDLTTEKCALKDQVECENLSGFLSICNDKNIGDYIKDPKTCSGWYQCIGDNYAKKGSCPDGQWFVTATGSCQWPKSVPYDDCENRCDGRSSAGSVVAPDSNCQRYYNCQDGETVSGEITCPGKTIFDSKTETCIRKRPDFHCESI